MVKIEVGIPLNPRLYQPDGYIGDDATGVTAEYEYCQDVFENFQVLGMYSDFGSVAACRVTNDFTGFNKAGSSHPFPMLTEYTRVSTLALLYFNTQYNNLFNDEKTNVRRLERTSQEYPLEPDIKRILADSVDGLGIELAEAFSKCL